MRPTLFTRIDLTPLVGVLLTLVAALMQILPQEAVGPEIGIPPADYPPGCCMIATAVVVSVSRDGIIDVDGARSSATAVADDARARRDRLLKSQDPNLYSAPTVFVRGDEEAAYGMVYAVMQSLARAGLRPQYFPEDPRVLPKS